MMVLRPRTPPSSPAPLAHRYAAAGLDRDATVERLAWVPSTARSVAHPLALRSPVSCCGRKLPGLSVARRVQEFRHRLDLHVAVLQLPLDGMDHPLLERGVGWSLSTNRKELPCPASSPLASISRSRFFRSTASMMLAGRCYADGSVGMSWFVLRQDVALPNRNGGLFCCSPLGTRAFSRRPFRSVDPAAIRQAVCEEEQNRCCRCRGDLRSRRQAEHALCPGQNA